MLLGTIFGQWYLQESHLLSDGHAAVVTTTLFVGMLLGSPLIGAFAQNARYERVIMCIGSLITLSLLILLELFSWSFISLIFIFFLIGLTASTQNIPYSIISVRNAPLYSATAIGLSSLIIMAFIGFSQPIFNLFIIQDEINDTVDFSMGLYLLMFLTVCTFILAFNHKPAIVNNDSNI
jgi:MFS family permease